MEELILRKYFEDKKKQIDIAKELNISRSKVSRVISKDKRHQAEKENRKIKNKKRNIEFTKNYIANKRKQQGIDL